ncbi:DUF3857 domain-containing protein [uncultured Parabacteroides sp.]|uniref:DUF3857 domain-containing protein n=1 Tax=uncultured Parabacteroides sp. TaxID=512312 RepID=UPI0025FBAF85|nr:DUF3857 domain-containing protein [uncultured Parabacteroides sp.]
MTNIINKFALLICLLALTASVFAASEAEYKKLSKAYTLNADGSQEFHYSMELTLFTHTAMNGTYGESFIVYNPEYQVLKINSSYTKQKDGNIVKTPDNAFVEVLPRTAADAPAYNNLKEMVVVHTGLELGATIYLDYTLTSKPGYLPELDIYDELLQTSPVKEYTISLSAPESKPLFYTLQNNSAKPGVSTANGMKTVTWKLNNLPASSRDPFVSAANGDVPFLTASTYASNGDALKALYAQFTPATDVQLAAITENITEGKKNDTEKVQAILKHVNENLGYSRLSLSDAGYKIRSSNDVIYSAYGTEAEKANLLNGLLNAAGIKAETAAIYRVKADPASYGLNAISGLVVVANADGKQYVMSPASNKMAGWNGITPVISLTNAGTPVAVNTPSGDIDYKVTLSVSPEKADAQVSATIGNAYLPYYGSYLPTFAGGDKDATEAKTQNGTTISYKTSQNLKANNGYVMVSLPDAPVSLAHSYYCQMNSSRKDNLLLPCKANERYTYTVQLPEGMKLSTPEAVKTIENAAGKVVISVKQNGNTAEVERSLQLNSQLYTPAQFTNLRNLLTEWGNASNRTLLLSIN